MLVGPEDESGRGGIADRGRVDLPSRFRDTGYGPFADEGERAFGWQRPDPEVVMPASAAASSSAGEGEHRPLRRRIRFSRHRERHPRIEVRRPPTVGELDSEPYELRLEPVLRASSTMSTEVSVHEERMLELVLVQAVTNLHRELEPVRIDEQRRDPQRSVLRPSEEKVERDGLSHDRVGGTVPGTTLRPLGRGRRWRRLEERHGSGKRTGRP